MERYAVSWPDVYAHANDDFDGLNTARFATLREAVRHEAQRGYPQHEGEPRRWGEGEVLQ